MKINKIMGIYIHIPFCIKKCNYCDFLSFKADDNTKASYVDALIKRICHYGRLYGDYRISTVFIGGGTPSLLPHGEIKRIMNAIRENFNLDLCDEVTIECNPGTVDEQKLLEYKSSGINRLSFGLQSAVNHELEFIGRIHTYEDFEHSYRMARACGFDNINIDLMSALPYQTVESYSETLNKVLSLKPEHISAYSLILEEGTPMYTVDTSLLPSEEDEREMYYLTDSLLKNHGYHRYEISNYSLPGKESTHNSSYWTRMNYLGIGLGSSSLMRTDMCYNENRNCYENIRFTETDDMNTFLENVETLLPFTHLSYREVMEEYMFLGLRLMKGINMTDFKTNFNFDIHEIYGDVIESLKSDGLIEESADYLYLTPLGIDVSNTVLAEFLEPGIS